MTEIYLENNELISEDKWKRFVKSLKNDYNSLETNLERSKRRIKNALEDAFKARYEDKSGILVSGGVDSSLLALIGKKLGFNFKCYSIGLEGSDDLEYSGKLAESLGLNLKIKIVDTDDLESTFKYVLSVLGDTEVTNINIGAVFVIAANFAKEDNVKTLFTGLGADSLFFGFEKQSRIFQAEGFEGMHEECFNWLNEMWGKDLSRDVNLANNLGLNLKTPFLDKQVIMEAVRIHPMLKISNTGNKLVLRELAKDEGLPQEIAFRKKSASQYGSKVQKAMDKIASEKGFKTKRDYLNSLK
ncbi:MAG: hypothetical protein HYS32_01035 [Candidatus Woesearchaeota archaeon]|nr:MAG: hypothetical protein HYS32_01035 [Candidatus Woesearchaeota archaeon]